MKIKVFITTVLALLCHMTFTQGQNRLFDKIDSLETKSYELYIAYNTTRIDSLKDVIVLNQKEIVAINNTLKSLANNISLINKDNAARIEANKLAIGQYSVSSDQYMSRIDSLHKVLKSSLSKISAEILSHKERQDIIINRITQISICIIIAIIISTLLIIYSFRKYVINNNTIGETDSSPQPPKEPQIPKSIPIVPLHVYNDAVNAFVNINERIYTYRIHSSFNTMLMKLLTSEESASTVRDALSNLDVDREDKDSLGLLLSDISHFKTNQIKTIDNFIKRSDEKDISSFIDCVRFPLGESYNSDLDEHVFGEKTNNGKIVTSVIKMGYYFPQSTTHPYRKKALILV